MEVKKSAEILKYEKTAPDILKAAQNLLLVDRSDLEISGNLMAIIKNEIATIKKGKDEALDLLKKSIAVINGWFKPIENDLFKADRIARDKHSALSLKLDNERRERDEKAEKERQEKEQKVKDKLLKRAEKAKEKGDIEKVEMLKEEANSYFQPVESIESVDNTINLESGKTHGVEDIKIVSLDPGHIVQGLAKGMIPIHYLKVVPPIGEPKSLSMTGFKQFMKSKFGCTDQDYYGIRVKRIIRPSVSVGV